MLVFSLVLLLVAHLFHQQLELNLLHQVAVESILVVLMESLVLVVLVFELNEQAREFDSRKLILDDQVHSILKFYDNKCFLPNKNRSEIKIQKF